MLEGEDIHKIMMSDANGENAFDITDTETIKSLIEAPSEIGLKKVDRIDEMDDPLYNMSIYTKEDKIYRIGANQTTIRIGGNYYSVKGENVFYQNVEGINKNKTSK